MAKTPAILAVHLTDTGHGPVRVGNLVRDSDGSVAFTVSESYLRDSRRPILSLSWYDPDADEAPVRGSPTDGTRSASTASIMREPLTHDPSPSLGAGAGAA
jgi:hypothetical protein